MSDLELSVKMAENSLRICHACNQDNQFDATVCVHCGASLGGITVIVPDKPLGITRTNHLSQMIRLYDDGIVLLIAAQNQPIVLKGEGKFLIGRQVENEPPPTLDLTKFGGHMLGVSRRHIAISRTNEGYFVEDLNSANGSFLNERRLQPNKPAILRNGDLIRLGQLILFAYFTPPRERRSAQPSEQTIWLKEISNQTGILRLTLQQLMSQAVPYLNAIAMLQNIVNDTLKRPASEMVIQQLVVEKESRRLKVGLFTYPDAIRLIQDKQDALQQKTAPSFAGTPPSEDVSAEVHAADALNTTVEVAGEIIEGQERLAPYREVAAEMLAQIVPSLPDADKESLILRLLVPLYTLATSRFVLLTQ